ncbi:MAG TPA: hypothetical protein DDZ39_04620, partial [Flavobacteriaceae bacterium]|nr:hypothetical protein [Flavobacteriaceae bacterium]
SEPNKVFFDSDKPITGSSTGGFTVSNRSISGLTVNDGQLSNHYFTVSESFTFWDNNTIRYEGGGDVKDDEGNNLHDFTLSYIENNIPEPDTSQDRYVTTSANGSGDGKSEATAWTWKEAFSNATAGMTVWIKAGNYGNLNLNMYNDGTSMNPIKFIGYKNSIGDITSNYYDYGVTWNTSEMPTLTGTDIDNGIAIKPTGINFVIMRNIQITNYRYGIKANTTENNYLVLERMNGLLFGGANPNASFIEFYSLKFGTPMTDKLQWTYSGNEYIKLKDIISVNASMAGIILFGEGNNLIDGVKSYNDRTADVKGAHHRTDYHIAFNGHNNIARNVYMENFNTTISNRSTHGLGVRGSWSKNSTYNLIEKSTAININEGMYIRNYGCNYNVIKDCVIDNNENRANYISMPYSSGAGVWIWGGADYNVIERVTIGNVSIGIGFYDYSDSSEDGIEDTRIGKGNIIRNCIINKVRFGVFMNGTYFSRPESLLEDTKIINCTFNDVQHFIMNDGNGVDVRNFEFINCNISNVFHWDDMHELPVSAFSFTNTNFFNTHNDYSNWMASSNNNTKLDPKYVSQTDLRLTANSPIEVTEGGSFQKLVPFDFEGKYRGDVFSIGAYQYGESTTGAINANAGEDFEICSGEEVTLTATGNGEFSWSNGETTASITVNPTEDTTYTVTVSDGENSESDEVVVTVNESPTVDLGEDVTICEGEEVTLTAEGSGDFLWSTGETTASITVNPTETITYSVKASNDCDTEATDEITVNVAAGLTLSVSEDTSICSGGEIILTAESNGDFLWNTGETTASITVNPTEETIYSVTSTSGDCSISKEITVSITELPIVSLGEDISICSGNEVTLTAEGNGEFLWNNGEITESITINPTETTTYSITSSVICGDETVTVSDEIIVNVTPGITLNAGEDKNICSGEEVILTAEGNQDFLWSTGETTASITVSPTETTTYSVTSSFSDCTATDNVIVTVASLLEVDLGEDITICSGEETVLTAQGSGNFLWSTGETTESITVSPTENTTYSVIVSGSCGEDVSDEIIVNISSSLAVNAGEDVSLCSGESVTLTAEGTGEFLWSTGETTASIVVSPTETTIYTVTASSSCGEDVSDEVIVNVASGLTLNAGEDVSICSGESVTLTATGNGNYLWSTGETTASITVSPTETTNYSVTSGSENCSITDEVEVAINDDEVLIVDLGEDQSICHGEDVILEAQGSGNFLWSTGEISDKIRVKPLETTTYSVTVTSNCGATLTDEITITVGQQITVDAGVNKTICVGESVVLTASGNGDFLWNTGETTASIDVSPNSPTTYWVTSSIGDCSEYDEVFVDVEKTPTVALEEDKTICSGDQITLIAQGTGNFLWSTGETTSSILVKPNENTTYSVTSSSSCS